MGDQGRERKCSYLIRILLDIQNYIFWQRGIASSGREKKLDINHLLVTKVGKDTEVRSSATLIW